MLNTAETDKTGVTSATVYMYCISAEAEEIHAPTPIPVFETVFAMGIYEVTYYLLNKRD